MRKIFKIWNFEISKIIYDFKMTMLIIIFLFLSFIIIILFNTSTTLTNYGNRETFIELKSDYEILKAANYQWYLESEGLAEPSDDYLDLMRPYEIESKNADYFYKEYLKYDYLLETQTVEYHYYDFENPVDNGNEFVSTARLFNYLNYIFYGFIIFMAFIAYYGFVNERVVGYNKNLASSDIPEKNFRISKIALYVLISSLLFITFSITGLLIYKSDATTLLFNNESFSAISVKKIYFGRMIDMLIGIIVILSSFVFISKFIDSIKKYIIASSVFLFFLYLPYSLINEYIKRTSVAYKLEFYPVFSGLITTSYDNTVIIRLIISIIFAISLLTSFVLKKIKFDH